MYIIEIFTNSVYKLEETYSKCEPRVAMSSLQIISLITKMNIIEIVNTNKFLQIRRNIHNVNQVPRCSTLPSINLITKMNIIEI